MPRILIADDNSNIQRMAALALKDAGIEVIAVGNGEAAVRKMPEVMPDLVLADIFMPVRNGYEVCEFVKHDPRYANIPVLLLAGAFDPFDEQEAQRVHADGVLKKPFVPPDPLINAVRTLLAKSAGDRLMAVTVPVEAAASAESGRTAAAAPPVFAPVAEESPYEVPEEFALPLINEDLGANEKAVALSPAPESLGPEIEEEETVVTASRDPILGEPAFWVPGEPEEAVEEQTANQDQDLTDHTWGSDGRPAPLRDDPPSLENVAVASAKTVQHADLVIPEPGPRELVQDLIPPAVTALPPAAAATATPAAPTSDSSSPKARPAEDTVPLPEAWVDSAALEMEPLESSSLSESTASPLPAAAPSALMPPLAPSLAPSSPMALLSEVPAAVVSTSLESEKVSNEDAAPMLELAESLPDWDEKLRAFQKPEPEPAPKEQVAKPEPETHPERETKPKEPSAEAEPEFAVEWPPAFVPAVSTIVNEVRASALQIVPAAHIASNATEPGATPSQIPSALLGPGAAPLSHEVVEAAIQRVMERMQPQIVELVTRDILRPLVEALVQQELKK